MAALQPSVRFHQLDGLRGLAALFVALFHYTHWHPLAGTTLLQNAYLMVDFFFVLSGFVLAHTYLPKLNKPADFLPFMVRRLGRLWPLHMLTLAVLVGLDGIKAYLTAFHGLTSEHAAFAEATSPAALAAHTLFLNAMGLFPSLTWNGPSWSIGAEFYTYAVFSLVTLFLSKRWPVMTLLSLASFALLCVFAPHGMDSTYNLGLLRCIGGFFAGVLTYFIWQHVRLKRVSKGIAQGLEITIVAATVLFITYAQGPALPFLAPLLFMALILVLAWQPARGATLLSCKPLQALGAWSYGIYLIHTPVLVVMGWAFTVLKNKLPAITQISLTTPTGITRNFETFASRPLDILLLLTYLGSIIVIAALSYRWYELPCQRWFNGWAKKL